MSFSSPTMRRIIFHDHLKKNIILRVQKQNKCSSPNGIWTHEVLSMRFVLYHFIRYGSEWSKRGRNQLKLGEVKHKSSNIRDVFTTKNMSESVCQHNHRYLNVSHAQKSNHRVVKNSDVQMSPNSNVQKSSALQCNKNDSLSITLCLKRCQMRRTE